jgi:hypothetical protein
MPKHQQGLVRVFVPDLDGAIPLFEELAQARAERFGFRDVELARVGRSYCWPTTLPSTETGRRRSR